MDGRVLTRREAVKVLLVGTGALAGAALHAPSAEGGIVGLAEAKTLGDGGYWSSMLGFKGYSIGARKRRIKFKGTLATYKAGRKTRRWTNVVWSVYNAKTGAMVAHGETGSKSGKASFKTKKLKKGKYRVELFANNGPAEASLASVVSTCHVTVK